MARNSIVAILALALAGCGGSGAPTASARAIAAASQSPGTATPGSSTDMGAARADLAPTGTLRVAVNYGNGSNAARDPVTGELRGVAVDLARELAAALAVPLQLVPYPGAPAAIAGFRAGAWDIYFSGGVPPGFPDLMDDAPPHLQVENTYVVANSSPFRSPEDVDRTGARIAVATGNNPDKFLTSERPLQRAQLVRADTNEEARQLLIDGKVDALAGGRSAVPTGFRSLDDNLFVASLVIEMRKGHPVGLAYLRAFVERAKTSGSIAQAISRAGLMGVRPAPAAR